MLWLFVKKVQTLLFILIAFGRNNDRRRILPLCLIEDLFYLFLLYSVSSKKLDDKPLAILLSYCIPELKGCTGRAPGKTRKQAEVGPECHQTVTNQDWPALEGSSNQQKPQETKPCWLILDSAVCIHTYLPHSVIGFSRILIKYLKCESWYVSMCILCKSRLQKFWLLASSATCGLKN